MDWHGDGGEEEENLLLHNILVKNVFDKMIESIPMETFASFREIKSITLYLQRKYYVYVFQVANKGFIKQLFDA